MDFWRSFRNGRESLNFLRSITDHHFSPLAVKTRKTFARGEGRALAGLLIIVFKELLPIWN